MAASVIACAYPQIRQMETEIPDKVPDSYDEKRIQDNKFPALKKSSLSRDHAG